MEPSPGGIEHGLVPIEPDAQVGENHNHLAERPLYPPRDDSDNLIRRAPAQGMVMVTGVSGFHCAFAVGAVGSAATTRAQSARAERYCAPLSFAP